MPHIPFKEKSFQVTLSFFLLHPDLPSLVSILFHVTTLLFKPENFESSAIFKSGHKVLLILLP